MISQQEHCFSKLLLDRIDGPVKEGGYLFQGAAALVIQEIDLPAFRGHLIETGDDRPFEFGAIHKMFDVVGRSGIGTPGYFEMPVVNRLVPDMISDLVSKGDIEISRQRYLYLQLRPLII